MSPVVAPRRQVEAARVEPDLAPERAGFGQDARIDRVDVERQRHRDVLQHGERVDQDAARRDHPDLIQRLQPRLAVGDRSRVAAEQRHVAAVGQRRAGDQVDEGFRRNRVQAVDGDDFAGADGERAHPQGAQRPGSS